MRNTNTTPSSSTPAGPVRRTVLQTLGGVAGLLGIGRAVGQTSTRHILTITAPYGAETFYQFVPTHGVQKLDRDPYGNVPASAVTIDGEDDIKGCLVHGATNGGADVYQFIGQLSYVNFSGPGFQDGTLDVYLDGRPVDPARFQRGTPPSSETNTDCRASNPERPQPTSTIVCNARRATQVVHVTVETTQFIRVNGGDFQEEVTVDIEPGNTLEMPFAGTLVCFAIEGGDLDVQIRYREQ
ncbi:hypothetical protein [Haladaptatus sp. NG-SE-30]